MTRLELKSLIDQRPKEIKSTSLGKVPGGATWGSIQSALVHGIIHRVPFLQLNPFDVRIKQPGSG